MLERLNLPPFSVQLRKLDDDTIQVFDPRRAKWLVLTPEEWVRQHFVNYLIDTMGYPASRVANEVGLKFNGMQRRCDTVVYSRSLSPVCIVEYKRPSVAISGKVFDQIARYNSVAGANYLMVSNGLRHFCCRFTGQSYVFLDHIPTYGELTSDN